MRRLDRSLSHNMTRLSSSQAGVASYLTQIQNKASEKVQHPTTNVALSTIGKVLDKISNGFSTPFTEGYNKLLDDAIAL